MLPHEPARDWPDRPLTPAEARSVYERDDDAVAVWVLDHAESVRTRLVPDDTPVGAVVDVVLERDGSFQVYSYTAGRWVDFGPFDTGSVDTIATADRLSNYRVLDGYSRVI